MTDTPKPGPRPRMRKPTLFSVARQARRAGLDVARYEVDPDGKISVITGKPDSNPTTINPWDEVLKHEPH